MAPTRPERARGALWWPWVAIAAQTDQTTVTRLADGDSIWAEDAHGTKLRIRLVGIDAPGAGHPRKEGGTTPGQPWGEEAGQALPDLVLNQAVEIDLYGRDWYKRILADVRHGDTNLNQLLVRSGLTWVCTGRAKRRASGTPAQACGESGGGAAGEGRAVGRPEAGAP